MLLQLRVRRNERPVRSLVASDLSRILAITAHHQSPIAQGSAAFTIFTIPARIRGGVREGLRHMDDDYRPRKCGTARLKRAAWRGAILIVGIRLAVSLLVVTGALSLVAGPRSRRTESGQRRSGQGDRRKLSREKMHESRVRWLL